MTEPTETVDLVGVRANGEHVNLGKVAMPPRMKAREIAQSYFGPFQDDDGSESEACFVALEELIDWLVKQGWTPPQPTQAQAGAVPLTLEAITAMAREHPAEDLCGWSYRMGVADAERHHSIGIKKEDNNG